MIIKTISFRINTKMFFLIRREINSFICAFNCRENNISLLIDDKWNMRLLTTWHIGWYFLLSPWVCFLVLSLSINGSAIIKILVNSLIWSNHSFTLHYYDHLSNDYSIFLYWSNLSKNTLWDSISMIYV